MERTKLVPASRRNPGMDQAVCGADKEHMRSETTIMAVPPRSSRAMLCVCVHRQSSRVDAYPPKTLG
ncbi:hypothetical protein AG1IA_01217 [Rhizoctonia solani AG-1 IA]|uniref:Uncharacterized protein n=1 Tax=Thanatephorus cucumeris (strain AG1-IA) TaxID=983506 RepID=L8X366_THACA|nr:hypothetical protein AG1IA_01217 [Rhizoctonia solani AG-1 IA]